MKNYNKGLSLVELMVAMVISLFLGAAMITLFISNKKAYTESERFARMQDNARYAINVMTDELRLVGFWGASRSSDITNDAGLDTTITNDCTGNAGALDFEEALYSVNTGNGSTAIGCVSGARSNTDVLMVKHVQASPIGDTTGDGIINSADGLVATRTYLMSNPQKAVLFDGGDTTPPSISIGGTVPNGLAWEYQAHAYYVSDPANANEAPTLRRKILASNSMSNDEVVADGVENFRVLFGIDTTNDSDIDSYVASTNIADDDWDKIMAMRIYLLMRSAKPDASYTDTKTYRLGDITVASPNDNYHRTVVSSTVTLRNPTIVVKGGF